MLYDAKLTSLIRDIILNSLRKPILYFVFGTILVGLSSIDKIIEITKWKGIFTLTDKIGEIFIAFAILTFIYNIIASVCDFYIQKHEARHQVSALIFSSLLTGARIIYVLAIINIIITIVGLSSFYLIFANNIINVILIGSIGWIAIQVLYAFESVLYQYMINLTSTEHLRIKALYTKMHIIRNIGTVIIVILTIVAILMSFSSVRNIGISLLASAGFLTAIIGLSAQKTLFSLFSGLQIALAQPIKIGDMVLIDGYQGLIEEITFTYVTLILGDGKRLMVPINYFVDKSFENWSHEGESLRSSFILHVDYLLPIEPLREELNKILVETPLWDRKASRLEVSDVTEKTVELRIQISAANADNLSNLRAHVKECLLAYIRKLHPEHFPKMRIHEKKKPD